MQFQSFLTFENIYMWSNLGILPFWIMLIFIPNSKFTGFFVNSIVFPLVLSSSYIYIIYKSVVMEESILDFFKIHLHLEGLYTILSTESFLAMFWLHFISVNIFLGSWIARDGIKYNIPISIVAVPLVLVYFAGPAGLVLYWIVRIFYSKKISFHD